MSSRTVDQFFEEFDAAMTAAGRIAGDVTVLPVSKGQSAARIRECQASSRFPSCLGENYLEELKVKSAALSKVEWHFLGRLQSRKIDDITSISDYVHTISRVKELETLKRLEGVPKFFIQVNISNEGQKNGAEFDDVSRMIEKIAELDLKDFFKGFMGMAAPLATVGEFVVGQQFATLRGIRDRHLPTGGLSMGMSDDYPIALREGATIVRIGTKMFGKRG